MRTIDTPDLPVPAIGIDTGTDVAATSVQNGPYFLLLSLGMPTGVGGSTSKNVAQHHVKGFGNA